MDVALCEKDPETFAVKPHICCISVEYSNSMICLLALESSTTTCSSDLAQAVAHG